MAFQKHALHMPAFASPTWAPLCSESVLRETKCLCDETCRWVGWGHKWNICFHYPKTNLVPIKSVQVRRSEDENWQSKLQPCLIPPPCQCRPLQFSSLHSQAEQGTHTLSDFTRGPAGFSQTLAISNGTVLSDLQIPTHLLFTPVLWRTGLNESIKVTQLVNDRPRIWTQGVSHNAMLVTDQKYFTADMSWDLEVNQISSFF